VNDEIDAVDIEEIVIDAEDMEEAVFSHTVSALTKKQRRIFN